MDTVLTNGSIKLGVYHFSDRKRPALCVAERSSIVICGYFSSQENAEFFMKKLCECVGVRDVSNE